MQDFIYLFKVWNHDHILYNLMATKYQPQNQIFNEKNKIH